jgi:hypothetical protein
MSDDISGPVSLAGSVEIAKADADKRQIFGWASVAIEKDGTSYTDVQGDVIEPEELEGAVYDFVLDWRESGDSHDGGPPKGRVIESMVFTKEKLDQLGVPEGTLPVGWWLGVQIDDPAHWELVKSGQRPAFSIEGQAIRELIEES